MKNFTNLPKFTVSIIFYFGEQVTRVYDQTAISSILCITVLVRNICNLTKTAEYEFYMYLAFQCASNLHQGFENWSENFFKTGKR